MLQLDHCLLPKSLYFLRRRSGASRTTKKVTSIPLEPPASCLERGWGVVVVVVVVGLGSSLQQVLASVELPLGGQQKLPYPRSLQPRWLTQGSCFSWSKNSWPQQYWPLQHSRWPPETAMLTNMWEILTLQCFNGWMEEIRDFTFWEIFFSLFGSHACQWPT